MSHLLLNGDCITYDTSDTVRRWSVLQLPVHEASKVTVKSLIPADQLVGESESWHEPSVEKKEAVSESPVALRLMYVQQTYLFFSQKMEANDPEKKMPSTAAKAITLSPKDAVVEEIHCKAQSAFFLTHGTTRSMNK